MFNIKKRHSQQANQLERAEICQCHFWKWEQIKQVRFWWLTILVRRRVQVLQQRIDTWAYMPRYSACQYAIEELQEMGEVVTRYDNFIRLLPWGRCQRLEQLFITFNGVKTKSSTHFLRGLNINWRLLATMNGKRSSLLNRTLFEMDIHSSKNLRDHTNSLTVYTIQLLRCLMFAANTRVALRLALQNLFPSKVLQHFTWSWYDSLFHPMRSPKHCRFVTALLGQDKKMFRGFRLVAIAADAFLWLDINCW